MTIIGRNDNNGIRSILDAVPVRELVAVTVEEREEDLA